MAVNDKSAGPKIGPPLLLRERRRRPSRVSRRCVLSHSDWRKLGHWYGFIDPERTWRARIAIGNASWLHPFWGVFGDPTILLSCAPRYTARVIEFPERRSEIARLRGEIEELAREFLCVGVA
jgi:hypothetical protein